MALSEAERTAQQRAKEFYEAWRWVSYGEWDTMHPAIKTRVIDDATALFTRWQQQDRADLRAQVVAWRDAAKQEADKWPITDGPVTPHEIAVKGRACGYLAALDDIIEWLEGCDATPPTGDYRRARGILKLPDGETPEAIIRRVRDGGDDADT